jgi:hypothetical protein
MLPAQKNRARLFAMMTLTAACLVVTLVVPSAHSARTATATATMAAGGKLVG